MIKSNLLFANRTLEKYILHLNRWKYIDFMVLLSSGLIVTHKIAHFHDTSVMRTNICHDNEHPHSISNLIYKHNHIL